MRDSSYRYPQQPQQDQVKVAVYAETLTENQVAQRRLQEMVVAAGAVALALAGLLLLN
ncbi:hypothetical protein XM38_032700 [Halomicronema hongdechloris C2206]|uniref:Uncharacterized protein n=1 Tax=Halomicronema hongdechloris C2206 TaxID=1641165 RepID=A0A1Z3HPT1_9CYAN|nr:hypothetical protein [Halomicronema hongdechloris]ASC72313.1 hypothetical protein XM38_032700 [Halomicronema hongdechloris C2206]